ncbi:MAG: signal transduction histidine kinase [Candidatus Azotimanducaceae bacterium]|jgi:signal transduction histidine kinase
MDFTSQLASAIHDLKNRLQFMLSLAAQIAESDDSDAKEVGEQLRLGLEGLNQDLVGLLGLYKLENKQGVLIREVYVADLLNACTSILPTRFNVTVSCDSEFTAYFDENLVKSVISDAIHNATRFANKQITISAMPLAKGVQFFIEDDGAGLQVDAESSSTGLGMHFAKLLASAHQNNGLSGEVGISHSAALGGAKFSLYLP